MKQIYCLLLLIIFLVVLYDNKLIEGNDHEYDTKLDANVAYDSKKDTSLFDMVGASMLGDLLPDEYKNAGNNVVGLSCSDFKNKSCAEGIGSHTMGNKWEYNKSEELTNKKKKDCMRCLKCKDNYAFTDEFYGYMCDAIAGCLDDPSKYEEYNLPYVYAYEDTNFGKACGNKQLNGLQGATCGSLSDNSFIDLIILMNYKRESVECHADILGLEAGGAIAGVFS